jgi:L-fuculose-phosphate aldolase
LASDRVLVTPTGLIKSELTAGDIVEVDLLGNQLFGAHLPTSDLDMHLRILQARSDVGAVVHAHPPVATGLGIAGFGFDGFEPPELIFSMGRVPLVPFGTAGTPELGDAMEPFVGNHDAMVLANHGAVTMGQTLDIARIRMESLEQAAKMILTARLLDTASPHKQSE